MTTRVKHAAKRKTTNHRRRATQKSNLLPRVRLRGKRITHSFRTLLGRTAAVVGSAAGAGAAVWVIIKAAHKDTFVEKVQKTLTHYFK